MTDKVAFTMKLKTKDVVDEYKRRHDEIWPDLSALLREYGISDYSIFLDENSLTLFAVQKVSSNTNSSNEQLREKEIMKHWWAHMADLMETNADQSPVTHPLKLVFHMD